MPKKIGKLSDTGVKEHDVTCPSCQSKMVLKNSKYGLFYSCSTWPKCDCKHSAHQGTGEPMGVPADKETRQARITAHPEFDQLWKGHRAAISRKEAYSTVGKAMGLAELHIGSLTKVQCIHLISLLKMKGE